jgi:hypothetical protein
MYDKQFFQESFALTGMQAEDYQKAFNRIHELLKEVDPLKRGRRQRFFHYEEEAVTMLNELHSVNNEGDALALLRKFFFKFTQSGIKGASEAARRLLSIRDSYIWPKYVYDDWKENED